jgi:hypothetical protein
MASVVVWIKEWLREITCPVQEVTVFFLMTGPEEWMVYVEEMPAVNSSGSSAAQALGELLRELRHYDSSAGTITRISHYKYLSTRLPFMPF